MSELEPRIHDGQTSLDYVLAGDYYIPAIKLPEGDDRPIGNGGERAPVALMLRTDRADRRDRMHRAYLEETNPLLFNHLILTGKLHTYLADLNEQAQNRYRFIVRQMTETEGVTEDLKRRSQWDWIRAMNGIVSRAEEIIRAEMINV